MPVHLAVFDDLLQQRPEINPQQLALDVERYYQPFAEKLIALKKTSPHALIVGVSAIQGAGKTTQGEIMEALLKHDNFVSVSRSIDDHYLTHAQLTKLRQSDPRYIRRGVTHDIPLALRDLQDLQTMTSPIIVSGYDKAAHHGDGDRFRWINLQVGLTLTAQIVEEPLIVNKLPVTIKALQLVSATFQQHPIQLYSDMGSDIPLDPSCLPEELIQWLDLQTAPITVTSLDEGQVQFQGQGQLIIAQSALPNAWRLITAKPDFIFYDGWMLGARRVEDESVFASGLPALQTPADQQFAKDINRRLDKYLPLWQKINFLNLLYVKNYQDSLTWRDQAEEKLRAKGEGMTHDQIVEFVHYFWRSVHPAIQITNLAHDSQHTQQVVIINDDHSVGEILTPAETLQKYP